MTQNDPYIELQQISSIQNITILRQQFFIPGLVKISLSVRGKNIFRGRQEKKKEDRKESTTVC